MIFKPYNLLYEQNVEPEAEGKDEDAHEEAKLHDGLQHVEEHDHVDPEVGQLSTNQYELI